MTYNHAKYITQCLNSIEQQQTSFPFEVIIGDDFSTDNNIALIQQFIASSTNKNIKYILLDRKKGDEYDINRQKKGRLYNFLNIINHCKGKYIALIDGDDYWTDSYK
ncbi:MAG: glycosyltransferase, partial [Vicingaceae bacterium]|nr:glycosyltransferase [Vicingaceae bacterium]